MSPYYADEAVTLYAGDCLDVLRELPDNSVDSVCTDPPYGINFMGKAWDGAAIAAQAVSGVDHTKTRERSASMHAGQYDQSAKANRAFQAWCTEWAAECLRVLKPGGHMLAFGGSRTWHRLTCAIEDAGFEIRDSIAWLYGSGFPKSLDVSKAIDKAAGAQRQPSGAATSLACEYVRAGVPCEGHEGETATSQSGLTIHALPTNPATAAAAAAWSGWGTALKPAFEPIVVARKPLAGTVASNVLAHGTGALNVDGCRVGTDEDTARKPAVVGDTSAPFGRGEAMGGNGSPLGRWPSNVVLDDTQAAELDRQSGILTSGANPAIRGGDTDKREVYGGFTGGRNEQPRRDTDSGGASRFFPTFRYEPKAPTTERPRDGDVAHPTVKPLDLMRWLVRLITPPGGTVLDPFAGSGTTAEACVIEGFNCIAIEREADYLPLIVQRLTKPIQVALI